MLLLAVLAFLGRLWSGGSGSDRWIIGCECIFMAYIRALVRHREGVAGRGTLERRLLLGDRWVRPF